MAPLNAPTVLVRSYFLFSYYSAPHRLGLEELLVVVEGVDGLRVEGGGLQEVRRCEGPLPRTVVVLPPVFLPEDRAHLLEDLVVRHVLPTAPRPSPQAKPPAAKKKRRLDFHTGEGITKRESLFLTYS